MPFRLRKHECHNLPYDVKHYDVSAEVSKNCVKYIFVGRCLLIFLTRQFLIKSCSAHADFDTSYAYGASK